MATLYYGYDYDTICLNCGEKLALEEEEKKSGKFTCPNCGFENLIQPEIIKSDEKTLSLVLYLSFFYGFIIFPAIIYAVYKNKSRFMCFHSLQAIYFQISIVILFIIVFVFSFTVSSSYHYESRDSGLMGMSFLLISSLLVYFIGIWFSIYAAVKSFYGTRYKIPVIGNYIYERVYGNE